MFHVEQFFSVPTDEKIFTIIFMPTGIGKFHANYLARFLLCKF